MSSLLAILGVMLMRSIHQPQIHEVEGEVYRQQSEDESMGQPFSKGKCVRFW